MRKVENVPVSQPVQVSQVQRVEERTAVQNH